MQQQYFRAFVARPQSVFLRRALFQVHLWVGVFLAFYVVLIGITGSALVFEEELQHTFNSHLLQVQGPRQPQADFFQVAEQLRTRYPGKHLISMYAPAADHHTFLAYIRHGNTYIAAFMHPVTGEWIGEVKEGDSWLRWLQLLHFNLLAGATGRIVNAVAALLLLLLCFTGIVIWWPGIKNWRRALTIDFSRRWRRINWDLHSATGFWSLALIAMWAFSGVYFGFPEAVRRAVSYFSPVTRQAVPKSDLAKSSGNKRPDPRQLLAEAFRQSPPNASFAGMVFPATPTAVYNVMLYREAPGDFNQADYNYFDQYTGKLLTRWERGVNYTAGDTFMWWLAPLHFGNFGGVWVKSLWVLLGLIPPVMAVTGLLMYWNRVLSKKWVRLRTTATATVPQQQPQPNQKELARI
jgi:uncharacterized iron-regulated membrane protein